MSHILIIFFDLEYYRLFEHSLTDLILFFKNDSFVFKGYQEHSRVIGPNYMKRKKLMVSILYLVQAYLDV